MENLADFDQLTKISSNNLLLIGMLRYPEERSIFMYFPCRGKRPERQ